MPENERAVALDAVVDALTSADLSDRGLFAADVDALKLAARVRDCLPARRAGLSEGATALYRAVLDQTCMAVLLVDGVDELVPSQRARVRDWLARLVTAYPSLPVVVTSRPAAAGQSWLLAQDFTALLLEPMSPSDIAEFCRMAGVAHAGDESVAVRDVVRAQPGPAPPASAGPDDALRGVA